MRLSCMILASAVSVVLGDFYSSRYDDFDVQPLLDNDRILMSYSRCFLDQGPCTPDAKDFRKAIPEALETTCEKCTFKQRQLIRKVIRALMEKHPDAWKELVDRYDPKKIYQENFDKFIKSDD